MAWPGKLTATGFKPLFPAYDGFWGLVGFGRPCSRRVMSGTGTSLGTSAKASVRLPEPPISPILPFLWAGRVYCILSLAKISLPGKRAGQILAEEKIRSGDGMLMASVAPGRAGIFVFRHQIGLFKKVSGQDDGRDSIIVFGKRPKKTRGVGRAGLLCKGKQRAGKVLIIG